jgi:hypothetical protein
VQLQAAPRRGRSPGPPLRSRLGRPADGESVNAAERADSLRPSLGGALSGRSCFRGRRCATTLPGSNPCRWKPKDHVQARPESARRRLSLDPSWKALPVRNRRCLGGSAFRKVVPLTGFRFHRVTSRIYFVCTSRNCGNAPSNPPSLQVRGYISDC